MRILFLDRQRHWAGQQTRTYALARRLSDRGEAILFACTPGSGYERRAREDGLPAFTFWMRGWRIPLAVLRLGRLVRRERVDVVDAQGAVDHNLALAAVRMARTGVVVRTKHNHTSLRNFASSFTYGRLTQRLIAVSREVRDTLTAQGVPPDRVDLIPCAVDTAEIDRSCARHGRDETRRRLGIPPDAFVIGTTSRPSPRKALDVACRAIAAVRERLPGREIVYLAAGPLPDEMRPLAAEVRIPETALRLPGVVEDVAAVLPAMDVFLLPSRNEGLPMSLLEAMAAGLPAIATPVGGVPDVVDDGENGLLVPVGDPDALAAAILRLEADRAFASRLAAAGRTRVRELHDLDALVDATQRAYGRALGLEPPAPAEPVPARAAI